MSLFGRPSRRRAAYLMDGLHWVVRGADVYRAFGALLSLAPAGSLLGLADGAWPPDLREYFATWGTQPDRSVLLGLPREFVKARFVPINERAMARLTDLALSCAEPELAVHIIVVHGHDSVLEWYDLPDDPIAIAPMVGEPAVASFAVAVAGAHEASTPGA